MIDQTVEDARKTDDPPPRPQWWGELVYALPNSLVGLIATVSFMIGCSTGIAASGVSFTISLVICAIYSAGGGAQPAVLRTAGWVGLIGFIIGFICSAIYFTIDVLEPEPESKPEQDHSA